MNPYLKALCGFFLCGTGLAFAGPILLPCSTIQLLSSLATGCEQVNTDLTDFSLINQNGPNAGQIATAFTGTSPTSGISATFASLGWTALDTGSPVSKSSTIGFDVQLDQTAVPLPPGESWAITSLSLAPLGAVASLGGHATNYVRLFEYFCAGSATFNCTSTSPNFGYLEYQLLGGPGLLGLPTATDSICFNNGGATCTVTTGSLTLDFAAFPNSIFSGGVTQLAIQNVLSLSAPRILNTADLGLFNDTFVEDPAPEPATFTLAAAALASLVALARRRRAM